MKNIALFCDGTWQHLDQPHPTNVANLARAVAPRGPGGVAQAVYYDDGVGVSEGVLDAATHLIGGALGKGLDYKIVRAYEFLALNFDPADRVFIFGFSRGAYTARCLAGLIRWMGILRRDAAGMAFEAMALYRSRAPVGAPKADADAFEAKAKAFRAANAHNAEPFVGGKAYRPGDPSTLEPTAEGCGWIQYVGVWDTVGSLGVPSNLVFSSLINAQYRFYDTSLSRSVRSARHAVSIDERRKTFEPTLWNNMDDLNANAQASALAYDQRPYQQQWFPGGHGGVGGGDADGGLSLAPMLWVAEGAVRAGLSFDDAQIAHYQTLAHPDAQFIKNGFNMGEFVIELDGMIDRAGPATLAETSLSARLRWSRVPAYRPKPLTAVAGDLNSWKPAPDPQVYFSP